MSWFMLGRYNLFIALLDDVAEPVLSPLRRVIPRLGMFDITPLIAIVILYFISFIIVRLIG
jgi:YggT family protein